MRKRLRNILAISAATLIVAGCGGGQKPPSGGGGGLGNGKPPTAGTTQKIHLVWKQATNTWKVKLNGGPEIDPSTAETKLSKDTGPTMFVVDIQGSSPPTFKDPGALSVWTGSKSAPQQGVNSTQILGPVIEKDGKSLVFYDLNYGDPVILYYGFSFKEPGIPPVDPIVNNGGGNWQ